MAPNWTARAAPKATPVTGPARSSPSRSATGVAGATPSPATNTKPPDTGCESAEMTR